MRNISKKKWDSCLNEINNVSVLLSLLLLLLLLLLLFSLRNVLSCTLEIPGCTQQLLVLCMCKRRSLTAREHNCEHKHTWTISDIVIGKNLVDCAGPLGLLRYRNAEGFHRRGHIASVVEDEECGHWWWVTALKTVHVGDGKRLRGWNCDESYWDRLQDGGG